MVHIFKVLIDCLFAREEKWIILSEGVVAPGTFNQLEATILSSHMTMDWIKNPTG